MKPKKRIGGYTPRKTAAVKEIEKKIDKATASLAEQLYAEKPSEQQKIVNDFTRDTLYGGLGRKDAAPRSRQDILQEMADLRHIYRSPKLFIENGHLQLIIVWESEAAQSRFEELEALYWQMGWTLDGSEKSL